MRSEVEIFPKPVHYILFLIIQLSFICLLFLSPPIAFMLIISSIFLITAFISLEKAFFAILLILLIIPSHGYNHPPFYYGIDYRLLTPLLTVLLAFLIIEVSTHRRQFQSISLKLPMIFFISYLILASLIGYFLKNRTYYIVSDFLILSLYGLYFFIPTIIKTKESFYRILNIFIITTGIIAVEYLIIFTFNLMGGGFQRVNPNQALTFIFSIPLIIGTAIKVATSKLKKFGLVMLIALAFGGIAVTFTRGLWIALIMGSSIMLFLFRKDINKKLLIIGTLTIVCGTIVTIVYLARIVGIDIWSNLIGRAATILEFSEIASVRQRLIANEIVAAQIMKNPIFGYGLGKQLVYSFGGASYFLHWIDNSYLMLLWKFGIVGTIPFLLLPIKSFIEAIRIFRKARDTRIKVFAGAMISFIIPFFVYAFASPLMIKYLLNLVWVTLFGLIESIKNFSPSET